MDGHGIKESFEEKKEMKITEKLIDRKIRWKGWSDYQFVVVKEIWNEMPGLFEGEDQGGKRVIYQQKGDWVLAQ
jgi:hypothetical protein